MLKKKASWFLISLLVLVGICRLLLFSSFPLIDPTEGRYAEIARQMEQTNNWVTPQIQAGVPFWGKPPLTFWLTASIFRLLGANTFSARIPEFLFIMLSVIFSSVLAAHFSGDKKTGFLCAIIAATSSLFYVMSGIVTVDPALTATVTLSFVAFALALRLESRHKSLLCGYSFFLGFGLSVLAKGLLGWVLIGVPIFVWIVRYNKWRDCYSKFPVISGGILSLIIAVPWHVLAEYRTPGFLKYYFIGEHFQRYLVSGWEGDLYGTGHRTPFGLIWIYLLIACLPWIFLLIPQIHWLKDKGKKVGDILEPQWLSYLFLWFIWVPLFFSPAHNVMLPYVLPSVVPFSVFLSLVFNYISKTSEHEQTPKCISRWVFCSFAFFVPLLFGFAALFVIPKMSYKLSEKDLVESFLRLKEEKEELVFIGGRPYSGLFYAGDAAEYVPSGNPEKVLLELGEKEDIYFAVAHRIANSLPPEVNVITEVVSDFSKFSLRKKVLLPAAFNQQTQ